MEKYLNGVYERVEALLTDCPTVLYPMMRHLLKGRGKYIRARLAIAVASGLGHVNDDVLDFAATVEILHLATLIHDDVIDDAVLRRGIETLSSKFGKKLAVICGDYLLAKCLKQMTSLKNEHTKHFVNAVVYVCQGEALQHRHNRNLDITFAQYYKIIAGKTAAMFAFSSYGAAVALNASEQCCTRLFKSGYNIGMAFQMIDDCLDFGGDISNTKKAVLKDLSEGVITYPLIYALKKEPSLKKKCKKRPKSGDIAHIYERVVTLGGVAACKEKAANFSDRAKRYAVSAFENDSGKAAGILVLADELLKRLG